MPRRSFDDTVAVDALASAQDGLVLRRQLVELGLRPSTISRWTRTGGRWTRLLPGTYLIDGGRPTPRQRQRAAVLYSGATAVLTGVTALRLHGMSNVPDGWDERVHVMLDFRRHVSSGSFLVVERTRRPVEPEMVAGLPVAPLHRALFDACRRVRYRREAQAMILEVAQRGLLDADELRDQVKQGQRRWTAPMRDTLQEATVGVHSVEEARFRERYLATSLPRPLWNPTLLTVQGEFLARPDAYLPELGLAIEIDSRQHHSGAEDWERTLVRHGRMTAAGLTVYHVVPRRFRADPRAVLDELAATAAELRGRPAPAVIVRPL